MWIAWIVIAAVIGIIAHGRGRNGFWWMLLSTVMSPLVVLLLFTMPPINVRKCPACAELIKEEATICRHCHSHVLST